MFQHHAESIEKLIRYFKEKDGVVALVLGGSVAKGTARPDSDIDATAVVTDEKYAELAAQNKFAEVITGFCTYAGGYFDIKYKTKAFLREAAMRGSEPTRNAYVKARVLFSDDEEIAPLIDRIAEYPEHEREKKIRCFNANLQLNQNYFLNCVPPSNAYMRAHLAQEIVYSVYRLILIENRVLFPSNRRLEETVRACPHRPKDILERGAAFLKDVSPETCGSFVDAFRAQTALSLSDCRHKESRRFILQTQRVSQIHTADTKSLADSYCRHEESRKFLLQT